MLHCSSGNVVGMKSVDGEFSSVVRSWKSKTIARVGEDEQEDTIGGITDVS